MILPVGRCRHIHIPSFRSRLGSTWRNGIVQELTSEAALRAEGNLSHGLHGHGTSMYAMSFLGYGCRSVITDSSRRLHVCRNVAKGLTQLISINTGGLRTRPLLAALQPASVYSCSLLTFVLTTTFPSTPPPSHTVPLAAVQYLFFIMSSSKSTTALSCSCFPEKLETSCLGKLLTTDARPEILQISFAGDEVRDPFATSSSSFGWADDVEQDLYSDRDSCDTDDDDEPEVSRADGRARSLSIDRFFASDTRAFGEGGSPLSAMAEDDEDEDDDAGSDNDSTDARSLVDRIFANGAAPSRYRVASVPSLGAIEEDDESELGDDIEDADCPLTPGSDFDSVASASTTSSVADLESLDSPHLSMASFSTLDTEGEGRREPDDPDFGWVWIEAEDADIDLDIDIDIGIDEPCTVPPVRLFKTRPLFKLRGLCDGCQAREWRWNQVFRKLFGL